MKYCDYEYGHKNITTRLCIATTGVNFDYLIITCLHIVTTGTKILLRVCTTGVDFDYLITTGLHIVTTGTTILLRVCVSRLRVYILITWFSWSLVHYVFIYFDYGYTGTTILLWVCLSLLRVFILTTLLLGVHILWIRIQVQSKYKLKNQLRV